jgi:hypothetical protein
VFIQAVIIIEGTGHAGAAFVREETKQLILDFLKAKLKPATVPATAGQNRAV